MIPLIQHSGKHKSIRMENRTMIARGQGCRQSGLRRAGGNLGGLLNCSTFWMWYWLHGSMCLSKLTEWYTKRMNFTLCKLCLLTKMKSNVSDRNFLCNFCFQSPCVATICFPYSEYKQCQHVQLHACLRRNVGQIIDLNSSNCCLKVEVIKAIWLIAAWKILASC